MLSSANGEIQRMKWCGDVNGVSVCQGNLVVTQKLNWLVMVRVGKKK